MNKIQQIQAILGVDPDGNWGSISQYVLNAAAGKLEASSFADPKDVAEFKKCKASGKTDNQCFAVGDNGIGFTGLNVTDEKIPYVAIPKEAWTVKWGTKENAVGKSLRVSWKGKTVICILGDTMPALKNIKNGAGIDFAPGACKAFNVTQPLEIQGVGWEWV